jgi:hypothetical protein
VSRTQYESEADLANERSAAEVIEPAWGVRLSKLPKSYGADWIIERDGKCVGWGEFKKRNMRWGDYPTIMLSVRKVADLIGLADVHGKAIFFVGVEDGLYFTEINPIEQYEIEFGGRTCKTRDRGDIEPVVKIPITKFRKIPT